MTALMIIAYLPDQPKVERDRVFETNSHGYISFPAQYARSLGKPQSTSRDKYRKSLHCLPYKKRLFFFRAVAVTENLGKVVTIARGNDESSSCEDACVQRS